MNWEGDDPDWEDDLYWDGDEENPEDTWEDFFVDWDENFTWFRHIIWYLLIGGVIISILCLIYHWIWVWDADENLVMSGRVTFLKTCKIHITKALISLYSFLGFLLTIGILYLHEIYLFFNETSHITITPKIFIGYSIIIWIFLLIISLLIHYILFEYEMRCIKANANIQKGADK